MTVYVVGCKRSRLVKIGWTAGDPAERLAELQTGSPYPLRLLWQSGPEYWHQAEVKLHRLFKAYRTHREWFDFGHADPVALVAAAIDLPSTPSARRVVLVPTVPSIRLDNLLEDLSAVLGDVPMPAAKVPALLQRHYPERAEYQRLTGKSLRTELQVLGITVPSTGNRWPVRPDAIRAVLADIGDAS